jgi:hypothetical protein
MDQAAEMDQPTAAADVLPNLNEDNDNSSNLTSQTDTLFSENPMTSSGEEVEQLVRRPEDMLDDLLPFSSSSLTANSSDAATSTLTGMKNVALTGDISEPENTPSSNLSSPTDGPSSPIHPLAEDFYPLYSIEIIPEIEIDDEFINFSICTTSTSGAICHFRIKRQFDDVEYLNHVLVNAAYPGYGLIVPPLPEKPELDQILENQQLASSIVVVENLLYHSNYQKDCWQLEQYLKYMIAHPIFGRDVFWQKFLLAIESPPKIKLKKSGGLLGSWFGSSPTTSGVAGVGPAGESIESSTANASNRVKAMHRDCDEFFQHERDWLIVYLHRLREFNDNFNGLVSARSSNYKSII